jgi:hypothetical protein
MDMVTVIMDTGVGIITDNDGYWMDIMMDTRIIITTVMINVNNLQL